VRNVSGTEAEVNVWTLDDQEAPTVFFTGTSIKDSMKVGAPGAAAAAITVASYTTRVEWTDIDGRAKLRSNSAIPAKSAGSYDTKWGFGLIDA
jgi:hypothetical protein